MLTLVAFRIRFNPGFDQCQCNHSVLGGMTVLAVIHQRNAVMSLGNIHPFLSAALKAGPVPTGVGMDFPFYASELDVERRLVGMNGSREINLQNMLMHMTTLLIMNYFMTL